MSQVNQLRYKINMKQFKNVKAFKMPYVYDGDSIRRLYFSENGVKKGFWTKLLLSGSG